MGIVKRLGIGAIHNLISGRGVEDCHPKSSITGLEAELTDIDGALGDLTMDIAEIATNRKLSETGDFTGTLKGVEITDVDPALSSTVNALKGSGTAAEKANLSLVNEEIATQYITETACAKDALTITNYVGTNVNIHPKVLYFANGWNGYKYWMAYTPYPDTAHENPCIAVSNDGITWTVPAGLTNPLDTPDGYTNSDTHLVFREDINTLELWWRVYNSANITNGYYRRTSTDGVTWTAKALVYDSTGRDILSPAIIYEDSKYKLWGVYAQNIVYIESADLSSWSTYVNLDIDWVGIIPRHVDMIASDLGYEFAVMAYNVGGQTAESELYYVLQREDGTFTKPRRIIPRREKPYQLGDKGIYRSSILKIDGMYNIYYTAHTNVPGTVVYDKCIALSRGRNIFGLHGYEAGSGDHANLLDVINKTFVYNPAISFSELQRIVRSGRASKIYNIGCQIRVPHETLGNLIFDIIGFDLETPTNGAYTHSLTLQIHNLLVDKVFDAPELEYALTADTVFITGKSYYTYSGGTYTLTVENTDWTAGNPIPASTYYERNNASRVTYGSNNWQQSAIRQWLNSNGAAGAWWAKQNIWDVAPSYAASYDGFLKGMDPSFLAVVGTVTKLTALNYVTDGATNGGGQKASLAEKFFLLSGEEVGLSAENSMTGGIAYPYYTGIGDEGRIKERYTDKLALSWYLRSPEAQTSQHVRYIDNTGARFGINANSSYRIAPACVIW